MIFFLRFLPLLILASSSWLFYQSELSQILEFDLLRYHHFEILEQVKQHPFSAPVVLVALYALSALLCLPQIPFLIMLSGYVLPFPLGVLCPLLGLSLGSILLFLSLRLALSFLFQEKGLSLSSLLFFQTLFSPFLLWVPSLIAATCKTSLRFFSLATFFGLAPFCFFLSDQGTSLQALFENIEISTYLTPIPLECYVLVIFLSFASFCFKKFEIKSDLIKIRQETKR